MIKLDAYSSSLMGLDSKAIWRASSASLASSSSTRCSFTCLPTSIQNHKTLNHQRPKHIIKMRNKLPETTYLSRSARRGKLWWQKGHDDPITDLQLQVYSHQGHHDQHFKIHEGARDQEIEQKKNVILRAIRIVNGTKMHQDCTKCSGIDSDQAQQWMELQKNTPNI